MEALGGGALTVPTDWEESARRPLALPLAASVFLCHGHPTPFTKPLHSRHWEVYFSRKMAYSLAFWEIFAMNSLSFFFLVLV